MQAHEVAAIDREYGTTVVGGQRQDGVVIQALIGVAELLEGHHVVPESPELLGYGEGKVLVGEESRHRPSGRLVVPDLAFDLVAMRFVVGPGVDQVFGA